MTTDTTATEATNTEQQVQQTQEPTAQQAEADFGKGFASVSKTTNDAEPAKEAPKPEPAKVDAKKEAAAPAKKEEPAKEPAKDPYAGVPAEFRPLFEDINKKFDAVTRHLRGNDGRLGAMQKAFNEAKKETNESGAAAPTQQQIVAAASPEKWKKLEEDFPEWASALNERFAADRAAILDEARKLHKPVDVAATVQPMLKAAVNEAREIARIDAKHSDWEETVNTPQFADWLQKQPAEMQALADSSKAADAIKLLDAFKEASKPTPAPAPTPDPAKKQQQTRLEAATVPQGSGGPSTTNQNDPEADFASGFKKAAKR